MRDLPTSFTTDEILSGFALGLLRDAAIDLDGLSYRRVHAYDAHSDDTALHASGDYRLWWGSIQYRAGMTTLNAFGRAASAAGTIQMRINGSLATSASATSTWSLQADISTGYSEGDILPIELVTSGNTTKTSNRFVLGVYASPVAMPTAYPGVPTFSTSYTPALLNQLLSTCHWLYDRITAVPYVPHIAQIMRPATHKAQTIILYSGGIPRFHTQDELHIEIWQNLLPNPGEYIQVLVDGSVVYTGSTQPPGGTAAYDLALPLTHTLGTTVPVVVRAVVTATPTPYTLINSRYTIRTVGTIARTTPYPAATPPAAFPENGSIAHATAVSQLNAIATMLTNVKSRIDGRPELWNRIRAFRRRFAIDERQNTKLAKMYVPRRARQGDRLVVHGKGVGIQWGSFKLAEKEGEIDYDDYTFSDSESLTDGEAIETKTVWFDQFRGLVPGAWYTLSGDCYFASEFLY